LQCSCIPREENEPDTQHISDLVFVQFNTRLLGKKREATKMLMYFYLASNAQDWSVEGCDNIDKENEKNERFLSVTSLSKKKEALSKRKEKERQFEQLQHAAEMA
jgi:hypothetical protein